MAPGDLWQRRARAKARPAGVDGPAQPDRTGRSCRPCAMIDAPRLARSRFPARRENTGKTSISCPKSRESGHLTARRSKTYKTIPYASEQGIKSAELGG